MHAEALIWRQCGQIVQLPAGEPDQQVSLMLRVETIATRQGPTPEIPNAIRTGRLAGSVGRPSSPDSLGCARSADKGRDVQSARNSRSPSKPHPDGQSDYRFSRFGKWSMTANTRRSKAQPAARFDQADLDAGQRTRS